MLLEPPIRSIQSLPSAICYLRSAGTKAAAGCTYEKKSAVLWSGSAIVIYTYDGPGDYSAQHRVPRPERSRFAPAPNRTAAGAPTQVAAHATLFELRACAPHRGVG